MAGLVIGKFRIKDRLSFTIGDGLEIAATSFHSANHILIFLVHFPF